MKIAMPTAPPPFKEKGSAADTIKERKLREACSGFEAIILEKSLRLGREGAGESGLVGGSFATDMYRSMYENELAKKMAQGKGMGFGEMLYRQITSQHPIRK